MDYHCNKHCCCQLTCGRSGRVRNGRKGKGERLSYRAFSNYRGNSSHHWGECATNPHRQLVAWHACCTLYRGTSLIAASLCERRALLEAQKKPAFPFLVTVLLGKHGALAQLLHHVNREHKNASCALENSTISVFVQIGSRRLILICLPKSLSGD